MDAALAGAQLKLHGLFGLEDMIASIVQPTLGTEARARDAGPSLVCGRQSTGYADDFCLLVSMAADL